MRQSDKILLSFFGDGASNLGEFHEALNMAAIWELPVVFICENNQYGMSGPAQTMSAVSPISVRSVAYGMPGETVDGNDILAVYSAAKEAVERARSGGGPSMIECVTYRLMMHTTSDDPKRYRTEAEVEEWEKKDPLPRFQKYLIAKGMLSDEKIEELETALILVLDP